MTCPVCGGKTVVIDSFSECDCIYRERKCAECGHRFTTAETECELDCTVNSMRYKRRKDNEQIKYNKRDRQGNP